MLLKFVKFPYLTAVEFAVHELQQKLRIHGRLPTVNKVLC
jgi:hypothetical protein